VAAHDLRQLESPSRKTSHQFSCKIDRRQGLFEKRMLPEIIVRNLKERNSIEALNAVSVHAQSREARPGAGDHYTNRLLDFG
jgi:hypothetical protein